MYKINIDIGIIYLSDNKMYKSENISIIESSNSKEGKISKKGNV